MKVLVINGSPKGEHSSTMVLTRIFLNGTGWSNAEIISVANSNISGCTGCFGCWGKTPGKCVLHDDMNAILPKLIAADIVIWSFPLYYYSVPGALKNLIDRQLPLALPEMSEGTESGDHPSRYDLSHQKHILISTCGFWTAKGNYDSVTAMFNHIFGAEDYSSIFCGQGGLFQIKGTEKIPGVDELKKCVDDYFVLIQRAGEEFANSGVINSETRSALAKPPLSQEVYEGMTNAQVEKLT